MMRGYEKHMFAVLAIFGFLVGGCGSRETGEVKAPLVKTMTVGAEKGRAEETFSGTVHGYFESPIAFQTGGRIVARYVTSGDRVKAGQALYRVDGKDAEEQAAAAQGALTAARAQYNLAKSTLARFRELHEVNAISDLSMEQTQNQFELSEAQLSQAEAALARADNNVSFTVLAADRDGVMGSVMLEVGQVVSAGTPVAVLVDDSDMEVHMSFTEKQYGRYSVGTPCTVTFWAFPGVRTQGKVKEVAAAPDTSSGTYDAKISLLDPPPSLAVGMTAEVRFDIQESELSEVPLTAIAEQSENPAVWVVRDGRVHLVFVETGRYGADRVEILSGLSKGDRVVTAGVGRLKEGQEVRL